jgi:serine phosphatase RsbU (regulator of sigma subunit)
VVLQPDGTVTVLPEVEADLLLGIDPSSTRGESEISMDRGSTVLLYTDGLVERRGQSLDDGIARLRHTLTELAQQDLAFDELCDRVLRQLLPARPEDDVALVGVRLHRQDRPRPAEAGPRRLPPDVRDEPETVVVR